MGSVANIDIPESEILIQSSADDTILQGTIVRRIGNGKDMQGMFTRYDDDGGMILVSIVDSAAGEYIEEAGILRIKKGDTLYRYRFSFSDSPKRDEALSVLYEWPLYKKNPELHNAIEGFVLSAYSPEQILLFKKNDLLARLFVPVQQKFKIGRFEEKIDWVKARKDRFKSQLLEMHTGDHITYLAQVPQIKSYPAAFYSAGTKPHYETSVCLNNEPFAFECSHGGHIRLAKWKSGKRCFIVDAGSQFKGKGNKTLLSTARDVVDRLKKMYPDFDYIPVEGRGAFGDSQSY